jgi:two-component system alkaline phosphatase synthesis response regulator PhoP
MKRVLIVDDSDLFLEMIGAALEGAGYAVATATDLNGLETQREKGPVDLILMDVQMPEAFGDDVAGVLRMVRGVNTPIYLLSSMDESELALRALEADIEGYISKRSGPDKIVARVRSILGKPA